MVLEEHFEIFQKSLASINWKLASLWNPGLESIEVIEKLASSDFLNKKILIEVYTLFNGIRSKDVPSGMLWHATPAVFLNIGEAIEIYNSFISKAFDKSFFPIASDDYLLVGSSTNDTYIYYYSPGLAMDYPVKIYDSLESMFDTFTELYLRDVIKYDIDGFCEIDFERMQEIGRIMNPKSDWWL